MLRNIFNSFLRTNPARFSSSIASGSSVFQPGNYKAVSESPFVSQPREVWLENFDTEEVERIGILTLNPEVFADKPRIDVIHKNVQWQKMYRWVSFASSKSRAEARGGGRKPWPQKGLGKARAGSIRAPNFRGGGRAHGPRSPTTHFYMLPFMTRLQGLTSTLSIKLAQDDLHVVKDLEIPTEASEYIKNLIEKRNWGPSVLIVDDSDIMPRNISLAADNIKYVNLMPVYGLNVYSMLKHNTLVLTEAAVRRIEEKILHQLYRIDIRHLGQKFKLDQQK